MDAAVWDSEPAAPGTSEPQAPDTPASAAAPSESDGTSGRDNKGRFVKQAEAPDTAPELSEAPAPVEEPAPSTDEPAEPEAQAEEEAYPEFSYEVAGRPVAIPGSKVGSEGLFIPADQLPFVQRKLIAADSTRQLQRDHGRALEAARNEGRAEVEKARKTIALFTERLKPGVDRTGFREWFESLDFEKEMLKAELEITKADRERVGKEFQDTRSKQEAEALVPQLRSQVEQFLADVAKKPEFDGVETKALYARVFAPKSRLFDEVFSEDEDGIHFDGGALEDELAREAQIIARERAKVKQITTASAVAKENEKRTGKSVATPPPVARVSSGKPAGTKPKTYTNTREADADIWG
jgi:hypothetical protein